MFVSIPFKREGVLRERDKRSSGSLTQSESLFQFPSNGKVCCELICKPKLINKFQFPSNGKVCCKRPLFALSGDAGSYTPKPYANCAVLFFSQNLRLKRYKPL